MEASNWQPLCCESACLATTRRHHHHHNFTDIDLSNVTAVVSFHVIPIVLRPLGHLDVLELVPPSFGRVLLVCSRVAGVVIWPNHGNFLQHATSINGPYAPRIFQIHCLASSFVIKSFQVIPQKTGMLTSQLPCYKTRQEGYPFAVMQCQHNSQESQML